MAYAELRFRHEARTKLLAIEESADRTDTPTGFE